MKDIYAEQIYSNGIWLVKIATVIVACLCYLKDKPMITVNCSTMRNNMH